MIFGYTLVKKSELDAAHSSHEQLRVVAREWFVRALAAEGELARRKAHAVSNLKQNRAKAA